VTYLLDINVLIALFDPAHVHHEAAHRWVQTLAAPKWATCPLTQNGFIRVLTNPAYPNLRVTPAQVAQRLKVFCEQPGHDFWPDAVSLTDPMVFDLGKLAGHRQIADLYLAGLAMHYNGRFATFDRGIPIQALVSPRSDLIAVVPTV
jgi:toxin-antitoxin system PIN domain toxin